MITNTPKPVAHTPCPWQKNGTLLFHQLNPGGHKTYIGELSRESGVEQCKANAALIVRAVNSHAALVLAMERMLLAFGIDTSAEQDAFWEAYSDVPGITSNDVLNQVLTQARAALALAKEQS